MNLKTYFATTEKPERIRFAEQLGVKERYLYLCSRGDRQPSSDLCKRIVKLDSRFTLAELRPDIWGDGIDGLAASDDSQPPVGTSSRTSKRKNGGGRTNRKTK